MSLSYTDWMDLVQDAKRAGLKWERYDYLAEEYPGYLELQFQNDLCQETAQVVEKLLDDTAKKLTEAFNLSFEENDADIMELALKRSRKMIEKCMFYQKAPGMPENIKNSLSDQVQENITKIRNILLDHLRRISMEQNTPLVEDLQYLMQKRNLTQIVVEYRRHGQL